MTDLILVGIQGSGKGTQGKILAEKFGYKIFETGGELRAIAKEDSELGRKVKEIIERGDLVSNEIVMEIVEHFFSQISPEVPVIFDGIPRSEEQRIDLEKLLAHHNREFRALEVKISDEEAMTRLLKRAELEGRADDNVQSIEKRIHNFYNFTQPLLDAWVKSSKLVSVNGEQDIQDVTAEMLTKLNL
jgi:adenylate kinase